MLRIDNLTYRIGARVLLDEADATINHGHRVGLVRFDDQLSDFIGFSNTPAARRDMSDDFRTGEFR